MFDEHHIKQLILENCPNVKIGDNMNNRIEFINDGKITSKENGQEIKAVSIGVRTDLFKEHVLKMIAVYTSGAGLEHAYFHFESYSKLIVEAPFNPKPGDVQFDFIIRFGISKID